MAARPNYTTIMTDEEFIQFKNQIDACVTHVIGDQPPPGAKTPVESPTAFYLSPPQSSLGLHRSSISVSESSSLLGPSRMSSKSDTAYESSSEEDSEFVDSHMRFEDAVKRMEKIRNDKLLLEKVIGRIVATESMA